MEPSDNAHALLGMDGFVVLATTEEDGELFVLVETERTRAGCPSCGVIATACDATAKMRVKMAAKAERVITAG